MCTLHIHVIFTRLGSHLIGYELDMLLLGGIAVAPFFTILQGGGCGALLTLVFFLGFVLSELGLSKVG